MSLRRKLTLTIGGLVMLLLLALELVGYYGAKSFALKELKQEGGLLARYQAERVRSSISYAEATSEFLGRTLQLYDNDADNYHLERLLLDLLEHSKQISAIEITGLPLGPVITYKNSANAAILSDKPLLSEISQSKETSIGVMGDRWLLPTKNSDDNCLYHLQKLGPYTIVIKVPVSNLAAPLEQHPNSVAYGFLATSNLVLFTNTAASSHSDDQYSFISKVLKDHDSDGDFYQIIDPIYGKSAWVGTAPVGDLDLKVGVVYLEDLHFNPLLGLAWGTLGLGAIGMIALSIVIFITSHSVTSPLVELLETVEHTVSEGFTRRVRIPKRATLEVERLALSFNKMLDDLNHFIKELEKASKERQAIESELAIAASIQGSMLPKFPFENQHCQAVGLSKAAKKVGGDFFNIFPVGDDKIGFLIGDVSGKGIPGAITMAFTTSLLEHLGRAGMSPTNCLTIVNRALCARDEGSSFVTVFFGLLELNGLVSYANAGHHPPVLFSNPDKLRSPEIASGLALGIYESVEFGQGSFTLEPHERLMLYTDGLTEAMNAQKEEYGEKRLHEIINGFGCHQALSEQLDHLYSHIEGFRAGATPNDDLTILILHQPPRTS